MPHPRKKLKLVLFGIDSADWTIMEPLLHQGWLPNLKRLIDTGVCAALTSVIPPITSVAWPSAFTGTNPGKHGLFGFVLNINGPRILSNADRKAAAAWEVLSQAGLSVGCFLIPFGYPPDPVNGWMIADRGDEAWDNTNIFPQSIYDETIRSLFARHPAQTIETDSREPLEAFVNRWAKVKTWRQQLLRHLLEHHPVDVLIAVDNAVDVIQHKLLVTRAAPGHDDFVAWAYQHADELLGEILPYTDDNTVFMIVSDHGAQPLKGWFDTSRWLAAHGYLRIRPTSQIKNYLSMLKRNRFVRRILRLLRCSPSLFSRRSGLQKLLLHRMVINLPATKAFPFREGIIINTPSRTSSPTVAEEDRLKVAEEIRQGIEETAHPQTGQRLVKAYLREELYSGPELQNAPDIVLYVDDHAFNVFASFDGPGDPFRSPEEVHRAGLRPLIQGTHRQQGIFVLSPQPDVQIPDTLNIIDIAPTLFGLLDVPIPHDCDGTSLVGGRTSDRSILKTPASVTSPYTAEQMDRIAKRLEDLGYL